MKILSIVGARPEFIQAMPVSWALQSAGGDGTLVEVLVHTGQHYDYRMSQAFFDQLELPVADYNLGVGAESPGRQVGEMLIRLEEVFLREQPDLALVRGDTNSTLAGALAASKMQVPLAHIEAGERSYDRRMPEEINRLVSDQLSELHLCASRNAQENLAREGIRERVYWVGDVMLDALLRYLPVASQESKILEQFGLTRNGYALVTIHRLANVENPVRLAKIVAALNQVDETVLFPAHPRTRLALDRLEAHFGGHVQLIDPLGYLDMLVLEQNARLIATDSGGVQREAYYLGIPCLTLREETEWVETVAVGWNRLVGVEPGRVLEAWFTFTPPAARPPIYGDGLAAERIVRLLCEWVQEQEDR